MNEQPPKSTDTAKIVGLVCATTLVIALFVYFGFTDWVSAHSTDGKVYTSPVINQLPLVLGFIATTIGAFIGNAVITGKVAKKVDKIERQTNGRTHVRDAQINTLVSVLLAKFSDSGNIEEAAKNALKTARYNDNAPEDHYTEQEMKIQAKIIKLTNELNELYQQHNQEDE